MITRAWMMFHLPDMNDFPYMERFFSRYNASEIMKRPVSLRYLAYRVAPVPPGAEDYGYQNYRVHENWAKMEDISGLKGTLSFTPLERHLDFAVAMIPAEPTEDFLGAGLRYDEKTILRWLIFYKYPEGVSVEEGEKWFLDVHAKEVMQQPGLIRYFSSSTLSMAPMSPPPPWFRHFFTNPSRLAFAKWDRVSEQWYEDANGWRKAVLESPPKYTKPDWAKYDKYPFFEPNADFVSTFILEWPTYNLLRDVEPRAI
ncbi:MAG: hypothetical protein HKP58_20365 [Desulfatitalea sp.]|nr:hypothetical protein [Desulfatitalea sp.]NNK02773.1 hypothetical protein [Desulfatitalea sp.]